MADTYQWRELLEQLKTFTIWLVSSIIDGLFVALWVAIQWLVGLTLNRLELSGIDSWVLRGCQILLAITTLVPVGLYVYVDIRIKWLRAQERIQQEIKRSKKI